MLTPTRKGVLPVAAKMAEVCRAGAAEGVAGDGVTVDLAEVVGFKTLDVAGVAAATVDAVAWRHCEYLMCKGQAPKGFREQPADQSLCATQTAGAAQTVEPW
jgi:hypothetical protein